MVGGRRAFQHPGHGRIPGRRRLRIGLRHCRERGPSRHRGYGRRFGRKRLSPVLDLKGRGRDRNPRPALPSTQHGTLEHQAERPAVLLAGLGDSAESGQQPAGTFVAEPRALHQATRWSRPCRSRHAR